MINGIISFFVNIDWNGLISPGISILEKVIRTVVVYLFLIIGLRIAGKRELAQLNPFDIVVLFLLSNAVQNALIGNDNSLVGGVIGAAVLLIINYIIVRYIYFNNKAERLLEGASDMLIENGVIKVDTLKKELITISELEMAARKQGFESLNEILSAEIDPDGGISFVAKKPTPHEERYEELLLRIDMLTKEVIALKSQIEKNNDNRDK